MHTFCRIFGLVSHDVIASGNFIVVIIRIWYCSSVHQPKVESGHDQCGKNKFLLIIISVLRVLAKDENANLRQVVARVTSDAMVFFVAFHLYLPAYLGSITTDYGPPNPWPLNLLLICVLTQIAMTCSLVVKVLATTQTRKASSGPGMPFRFVKVSCCSVI